MKKGFITSDRSFRRYLLLVMFSKLYYNDYLTACHFECFLYIYNILTVFNFVKYMTYDYIMLV